MQTRPAALNLNFTDGTLTSFFCWMTKSVFLSLLCVSATVWHWITFWFKGQTAQLHDLSQSYKYEFDLFLIQQLWLQEIQHFIWWVKTESAVNTETRPAAGGSVSQTESQETQQQQHSEQKHHEPNSSQSQSVIYVACFTSILESLQRAKQRQNPNWADSSAEQHKETQTDKNRLFSLQRKQTKRLKTNNHVYSSLINLKQLLQTQCEH